MKFLLITLLLASSFVRAENNITWQLKDITGQTHQFPEDAIKEQQVTVLFFWATWCPYCKQLMPHIQSALHQYQDDLNLQVYALNIKEDQDPMAYLNNNGYRFKLFPEAESVADLYQVYGVPAVLIFDQHGQQVFDLREVKTDHLVRKNASHGAKSLRLAPYWAAQIRKTLQQLVKGA